MSWLALLLLVLILTTTLTSIIFMLVWFGIESNYKGNSTFLNVFQTSLNILMRAAINKGTNTSFKSQTYKIVLFVLMTLGLVTLSYYKAQMNAALNANVNEIPIQSWKDVEKSHYKILLWFGATAEAKFKDSPNGKLGNILRKIYNEKILTVPEEKRLHNTGIKKSVPEVLTGEFVVFSSVTNFIRFEEYPCQITDIKSRDLR